MLIALLIAFAWAIFAVLFDYLYTQKGLKAGVAVEGNPMVVEFFGKEPKLWQCLILELPIRVGLLAAFLFLPAPASYPLAWKALGLGAFIVYGLKNLQGGLQWRWLLKHPGQKLPQPSSAWAQFLGFWG